MNEKNPFFIFSQELQSILKSFYTNKGQNTGLSM